jgi:hypothetical protein
LIACAQDPRAGSSSQSLEPERGVTVRRDGASVRYSGEMTEAGLAALKTLTDGREVRSLEVDSAGGEIMVGMDFGDWVLERRVEVIVDALCLSSCANYVFTAAPIKTIRPGGVVAWHGSARQRGLMQQLEAIIDEQVNGLAMPSAQKAQRRARMRENTSEYLRGAQARQDSFFARIGVDERVTRIGNEDYGVKGMYFLSVPDMARFGIDNVNAAPDYPRTDVTPLVRRTGMTITYLPLPATDPSRPTLHGPAQEDLR